MSQTRHVLDRALEPKVLRAVAAVVFAGLAIMVVSLLWTLVGLLF
jgi:hypothetical protein